MGFFFFLLPLAEKHAEMGHLQLPSPTVKSSSFSQRRWKSKPEVCSGLILQVPGKQAKINREKKIKSIALFNTVWRRGKQSLEESPA